VPSYGTDKLNLRITVTPERLAIDVTRDTTPDFRIALIHRLFSQDPHLANEILDDPDIGKYRTSVPRYKAPSSSYAD